MAIELYMENFSSRETLSLSPLFRSIHVILIFENNKKKKNKIKVFLEPSEGHKFSSYPRKNITYILFTETVREVVDNHRLRTAISLQNCTCTTTWLSFHANYTRLSWDWLKRSDERRRACLLLRKPPIHRLPLDRSISSDGGGFALPESERFRTRTKGLKVTRRAEVSTFSFVYRN